MSDVKATVDVNQPLRTVYNQWTQFEEFPNFMEGIEEVTQLGQIRDGEVDGAGRSLLEAPPDVDPEGSGAPDSRVGLETGRQT